MRLLFGFGGGVEGGGAGGGPAEVVGVEGGVARGVRLLPETGGIDVGVAV